MRRRRLSVRARVHETPTTRRKNMKCNKSCVRHRSTQIMFAFVGAAGCRQRADVAFVVSILGIYPLSCHIICAQRYEMIFIFARPCAVGRSGSHSLTLQHVCNVIWFFVCARFQLQPRCRRRRQWSGFCCTSRHPLAIRIIIIACRFCCNADDMKRSSEH